MQPLFVPNFDKIINLQPIEQNGVVTFVPISIDVPYPSVPTYFDPYKITFPNIFSPPQFQPFQPPMFTPPQFINPYNNSYNIDYDLESLADKFIKTGFGSGSSIICEGWLCEDKYKKLLSYFSITGDEVRIIKHPKDPPYEDLGKIIRHIRMYFITNNMIIKLLKKYINSDYTLVSHPSPYYEIENLSFHKTNIKELIMNALIKKIDKEVKKE